MNATKINPFSKLSEIRITSGTIFGVIIILALVAFEMFNYSTTDFALRDLLGDLRFANIPWATILAFAFCGIDFAGIARLFTPEQGKNEPREIWYLMGAWLLAATMNAMLTWWGVSMAIINHNVQSSAVVDSGTILKVVPIFVAIMVWVIRILIIGTISVSGEHLWKNSAQTKRQVNQASRYTRNQPSETTVSRPAAKPSSTSPIMPRPTLSRTNLSASADASKNRGEPTYHSLSMSGPKSKPPANL